MRTVKTEGHHSGQIHLRQDMQVQQMRNMPERLREVPEMPDRLQLELQLCLLRWLVLISNHVCL